MQRNENMKRNIFKTITSITLICLIVVNVIPFNAFAAEEVSPRYTNCNSCDVMFSINSSGVASTDITYTAYSSTFTQAKLSVKIQKKTLWFFWTTVDIGTSDDVWTGYCTDIYGEIYYDLQLSSTGTYRAIITVEFFGNTGVVDTIEETMEDKYS